MADANMVGVKFQGIDKFCEELGKLSESLGQLETSAAMYQRLDRSKSHRLGEQLWIDWLGKMSEWFTTARDYFGRNWFMLQDYDVETYNKLDEDVDWVQNACETVLNELRESTSDYLTSDKVLDDADERSIGESGRELSKLHKVRFYQRAIAEASRIIHLGDGGRSMENLEATSYGANLSLSSTSFLLEMRQMKLSAEPRVFHIWRKDLWRSFRTVFCFFCLVVVLFGFYFGGVRFL